MLQRAEERQERMRDSEKAEAEFLSFRRLQDNFDHHLFPGNPGAGSVPDARGREVNKIRAPSLEALPVSSPSLVSVVRKRDREPSQIRGPIQTSGNMEYFLGRTSLEES